MTHVSLADSISSFLKKFNSKKGEVFAELAANWSKIVGFEFASLARPTSIQYYKTNLEKRSVLSLLPSSKSSLLELQFSERMIMERINSYFGHKAITGIKIKKS